MEDNKIYGKLIYKCGVCGKEHENVLDRAQCEITCTEKKAEEEKLAALRKKEAEYSKRKEEVDNAFNVAYELRSKFIADYGSYKYSWSYNNAEQPSIWRFFV